MFLVFLIVIMPENIAITVNGSIICKDILRTDLMCFLYSIYGVLRRNIYISLYLF